MAILENLKNIEGKKIKNLFDHPYSDTCGMIFDLILLVFLLFHKLNLNLFVWQCKILNM